MKSILLRSAGVSTLGLALTLSSCVGPYGPGYGPPGAYPGYGGYGASPGQTQGTVAGALVGAAAGGIIGNQSGRGLEGAAIGGLLGAFAGGALGQSQDQYRYQPASYGGYPATSSYPVCPQPPPASYDPYAFSPGY